METSIKERINEVNNKKSVKSVDEESWITNSLTFFGSSSHTYKLLMKAHFTGSSFYLGNLFIPMLITFGVLGFMPPYVGISWILFLTLTFAGLSTYGTLFFTLRNSTIIKNVTMTSNETSTLYFSTFWAMFTSIIVTTIVYMSTIIFLDKVGFTIDQMSVISTKDAQGWTIDYSEIWWGVIIYYAIMQTLVCFSLSFVVEQLVSTQKNFFIYTLVYILAGIFFSGMISGTLYINNSGIVDVIPEDLTDYEGVMLIKELQWGSPMWIVGQFFPHYGLNQIVWNSLSGGAYYINELGVRDYSEWNTINIFDIVESTRGAYYIFAPLLWSFGLLFTASMLERYKQD